MPYSKRIFDLICAFFLILLFSPVFLLIGLVIKLTSSGPAIHWSKRVGRGGKLFLMPKFRTMKINTPQLATHLLQNAENYCTPIGGFLRKTSLDELPQLWSILTGQMTFVGPRPALYNQHDLMALRTKKGIHFLTPGVTGLAQIMGRDHLGIEEKVRFEEIYLQKNSFFFDLKILLATFFQVLRQKDISH